MLSGATIVLLSFFDNFSREGLLEHRGVVILADDMDTLTLTKAESDIGGAVPGSEAVIYFKYINFGSNLRIFSINPKYHWAFDEIKPINLKSGHFPTSTY
ncbi:MAG: hypothetical protein ACFE8U_13875, partial [Candidatus Hermodarchaeota archaeon]